MEEESANLVLNFPNKISLKFQYVLFKFSGSHKEFKEIEIVFNKPIYLIYLKYCNFNMYLINYEYCSILTFKINQNVKNKSKWHINCIKRQH